MSGTLLIWGAGAIGGTIGACLARAGQDVLFVDSAADHVAAMQRDGLAIEGPIEQFTVPVAAMTPGQVRGEYDRILLCVKAHHTADAARALLPFLSRAGYVASFQNGLNEPVIGAVTGMDRVLGAFVNLGADYLEPGRILFGGRGACVVGEVDGTLSERVTALRRTLLPFEPETIVTDDILGTLWGKVAYGALLFATAITNDGIADILAADEYRAVLLGVGREAVAVAVAKGARPRGFNGFDQAAFAPGGGADAIRASFDEMVTFNRRSAKSHSGIWRDLAIRHRQTEVDAQLGPVVAGGSDCGIATPLTARLIALIHEIERGERRLDRANLAALAAAAPEAR